ncbi:MAG: hypothetical protein CM15mV42_0920 [uncultured marine virus]|nr:MAG: hypothetical protein CM15mV42_0920 [uncultured marine virus]
MVLMVQNNSSSKCITNVSPDKNKENMYTITLDGKQVTAPLGNERSTGGNTLYELLMTQTVDADGKANWRIKV